MFRGTTAATARTLFASLAAVLFILPFFTPPTSFAAAHTARYVEAKAQPGTKPSGKALRAEGAAFHSCTHAGDPTGPLRIRDRHRTVDSASCAAQRPQPARHKGAESDAVVPNAAYDRMSRPSTAHSPAALQVFRC
ncbi:hypothetical protein SSP24_14120 [Streptomyces spinoverrucosus]|uniref:Uncharacterized protein n=1 Tax=Streptomyces spinoverrucosus TaxID=284043 RepID=A0A4Y3V9W4_9ACTN|nr:hypothetical protein [Streptomyces spinoverrucosus]GEC03757.1 hypothetical protein SSP24_14120 [Streptomyces spinoverrucosus]GHB50405.1 hypothetical protein GCM10010397_20550 [Streptomyces spinoverrucosus]